MSDKKKMSDPLGLLTLLIVAGAVFGGMWMTVEVVNAQADQSMKRIDASVRVLQAENSELRSLLKRLLRQMAEAREAHSHMATAVPPSVAGVVPEPEATEED